MDQLLEQLEASLADLTLSTPEKHALLALLRERPRRADQLRQLRNRAFELVLERSRDSAQVADMPKLVAWVSDVVRMLDQASPSVDLQTEVWFSPGPDCRRALLGQLKSCRKRLDICVYTISDDELTHEIIGAHRRRVQVRVITDDAKGYDHGSDVQRLREAGIALLTDASSAHMHHKFALFDGRWLVNGSFNWTRSATQSNDENLVVTNDPEQLRQFAAHFEQLWSRYG
ncbi:MAG: phospholipase D-like domain-containing protein [Lysobacterales bacterium]